MNADKTKPNVSLPNCNLDDGRTKAGQSVVTCNGMGYTRGRGDHGIPAQGNGTVLCRRYKVRDPGAARRPSPPDPWPPECVNQRARYEFARLGSPPASWLQKGHLEREGERQLASDVQMFRQRRRRGR